MRELAAFAGRWEERTRPTRRRARAPRSGTRDGRRAARRADAVCYVAALSYWQRLVPAVLRPAVGGDRAPLEDGWPALGLGWVLFEACYFVHFAALVAVLTGSRALFGRVRRLGRRRLAINGSDNVAHLEAGRLGGRPSLTVFATSLPSLAPRMTPSFASALAFWTLSTVGPGVGASDAATLFTRSTVSSMMPAPAALSSAVASAGFDGAGFPSIATMTSPTSRPAYSPS